LNFSTFFACFTKGSSKDILVVAGLVADGRQIVAQAKSEATMTGLLNSFAI